MFSGNMDPEARVYCVMLLILSMAYFGGGITRRIEHKAAERFGRTAERKRIDEWAAETRRSIAAAEARAADAQYALDAWQRWYDDTMLAEPARHATPADPDATALMGQPVTDATMVMGQPATGGTS